MKLIYIDTETTGLNPKVDSLFQVAGYIMTENGEEPFNFKFKPYRNAKMGTGAVAKTGITDEILSHYPPQDLVFQEFKALLDRYVSRYDRKDKFFVIGYNINFDTDFLREWFLVNNDSYYGSYFWTPNIDVMSLAIMKLIGKRPYMENFQLGTVYQEVFGHLFDDAHDALADATATRELFNELWRKQ